MGVPDGDLLIAATQLSVNAVKAVALPFQPAPAVSLSLVPEKKEA